MMLKYLIQTSIFRYSKNYGSLTHETRIKDAVNMADLICLLATVRTLKYIYWSISPILFHAIANEQIILEQYCKLLLGQWNFNIGFI